MTESSSESAAPAVSARDGEKAQPPRSHIPWTRISAAWTFVTIAIVILVMVLVFILENLHPIDAAFFGVHWRIPLGLDLLLAALLGATVVVVVGAARTLQLRLLARRNMRAAPTPNDSSFATGHDQRPRMEP